MKKIVRILGLLILIVVCISLCGCHNVDDLRAMRAAITAEGNIRLADGKEYKALPTCEELRPIFDNNTYIYVVEEDVPLLLMEMFGDYASLSDDGCFVWSNHSNTGKAVYYCRTDLYDDILSRINQGFMPETYGYWHYDEISDRVFQTLTAAQTDAIAQVCAQTPEFLPKAASLSYDKKRDLYLCTSDKLFMRDALDVCRYEEKYYLVSYAFEKTALYAVPEDLAWMFARILED